MSLGRLHVRVTAAPALHLLRYQLNTRFWPGKTVLQILDEVLKPALAAYGRKFETQCDPSGFQSREYCVQYRETDLEFVARLMHEEGIVYAFEHEQGDIECLVLYDSITRAERLGVQKIMCVLPGNGVAIGQSIESLDWSCRLGTTSVVQRDWAWKVQAKEGAEVDPPISLQHERRGTDDRNRDRERYDHDDPQLHEIILAEPLQTVSIQEFTDAINETIAPLIKDSVRGLLSGDEWRKFLDAKPSEENA